MHLRRPGVALGSPPTTDTPVGVPGPPPSTAGASCLPRLVFNQVISQQAGPALPAPANSPASLLLLAAFPAFGSFYKIGDALGSFSHSAARRTGWKWQNGVKAPEAHRRGKQGKEPSLSKSFIQAYQEETRKSMNCMEPLYPAGGIFLPRVHPFIQKLFEVNLLHARPCEH